MGKDNNAKKRTPHRLKELAQKKRITPEEFYDLTKRTEQTFKGYKEGESVPIDVALQIADKYDITLDWFYCRNSFLTETDLMIAILSVLDKVFKLRQVTKMIPRNGESPYKYTEMALLIDERFYKFIMDIQDLEHLKSVSDIFSKEDYQKKREEIYLKHKDCLTNILALDSFNEEKAIQVESFEGINIINIFADAINSNDLK